MDQITLDRIKLLHPKVKDEVLASYKHVNNKLLGKGVRLRFAYTLRSMEEQEKIYAQGRTKLFDDSGKRLGIVTNARPGQSFHNYGLAFDFVLLIDKDGNGSFKTASWDIVKDFDKDGTSDWMEVVKYFESIGWKWGGRFKSFKDYPHFEKTFGHSWSQLQSKYYAKDALIVNGLRYPNI